VVRVCRVGIECAQPADAPARVPNASERAHAGECGGAGAGFKPLGIVDRCGKRGANLPRSIAGLGAISDGAGVDSFGRARKPTKGRRIENVIVIRACKRPACGCKSYS
jgi:hypothetical protein